MRQNDTKIIELPISVLSHVSGGGNKQPDPSPKPAPAPTPAPKPPEPDTVFTNPAFYVIWDWD